MTKKMIQPPRNHGSLLHVTTAETRSHQQQAPHIVVAISALHAVTNRHVLGLRQPTQQPYQALIGMLIAPAGTIPDQLCAAVTPKLE